MKNSQFFIFSGIKRALLRLLYMRINSFSGYEAVYEERSNMKEESVIAQAFFNIIIHVPPTREQSAIAMVLQIADVEIIKSEVKLKLLEKQKRGLMQ